MSPPPPGSPPPRPGEMLSGFNSYLTFSDFNYFYDRCGLYIKNRYNATYNDLLLGKIGSEYHANGPLFYQTMDVQLRNLLIEGGDVTKLVNKVLKEKMSQDILPPPPDV